MCSHSHALLLIIFKSSCKLPKFADNNDGETICAILFLDLHCEDSIKSVEMQSKQDKKQRKTIFATIDHFVS
jgi:uncharacterized Zn finger protein (UPF0148 family)